MSNLDQDLEFDQSLDLTVHPRESESISLQIPKSTIASLQRVAAQRDMQIEALVKLYIGKGLRQDLSQLFASELLDSTAKVLARYHHSEAEVARILQEIRLESK